MMIGRFSEANPKMTIKQLVDKYGEADAYFIMSQMFKRPKTVHGINIEPSAQDMINEVGAKDDTR